ncbi:MAG TPA: purine-nucleoside phosphorylase [Candidatus Alistipes excrementipullorum]|nr:purine-nucleoside phosphorylase [Candidatus Alistipes excrementipullorum]
MYRYIQGQTRICSGHGMGIPSIGIYSYELFNFYGVKTIIRTGSAGAYDPDLKLGDIAIGMGSCTNSNYADQFNLPGTFAAIADFGLVRAAAEEAEKLGINYKVGNLLASDTFYSDSPETWKQWQKMGVLAVEMEATALYLNAARSGNKALTICSISDSLITGEELSSEARQTSFTNMMHIAFEII